MKVTVELIDYRGKPYELTQASSHECRLLAATNLAELIANAVAECPALVRMGVAKVRATPDMGEQG